MEARQRIVELETRLASVLEKHNAQVMIVVTSFSCTSRQFSIDL